MTLRCKRLLPQEPDTNAGARTGSLADRVAVVTGGARGMGRSHALTLARHGAHVVVCDVGAAAGAPPSEELRETARQVEALGVGCLPLTADVRDAAALERVAARTLERFERLDVLVANAGVVRAAPLLELSEQAWRETLDVDLTGVFLSIRACAPAMVEQRRGRIVVIGSVSGRIGQPRLAAYNAAKWGVIGLAKAAAIELAPHGVTVNVVCPGTIDTPLIHHPGAPREFMPDAEDPTMEDLRALLASWNPMGVPWIPPEDVSEAVAFLAGDDARHITGTTLDVAAGWNAHYTA